MKISIYSNYQQIQHLGYAGHEIATESISQQQGLQDKGYEEWVGEMIGMREILRHFSNVTTADVVGMRAPFLKPGRNTQYKVSFVLFLFICLSKRAGRGFWCCSGVATKELQTMRTSIDRQLPIAIS